MSADGPDLLKVAAPTKLCTQGMLKALTGGDPPPPAPVASATTPAPTDPAAAAAPSTASGDPAALPAAGPLPDSDDPLSADRISS